MAELTLKVIQGHRSCVTYAYNYYDMSNIIVCYLFSDSLRQ